MRVTHRPARFGGRPSRPDLLQPGGRKAWRYASEVGLADIPCPSLAEQPGVRCLPQLGGESRATAGIAPCCNRGGALPQPAAPTDSVVTTRREPVVTTRTQPQHARAVPGQSPGCRK
jgi:hypothetical protein